MQEENNITPPDQNPEGHPEQMEQLVESQDQAPIVEQESPEGEEETLEVESPQDQGPEIPIEEPTGPDPLDEHPAASEGEAALEPEEVTAAELNAVIADDENFEANLKNADAKEIVVLLENIAAQKDISKLISKARSLKMAFDERAKTGEAELDKALESRYQTALARFNRKRHEYNSQLEKEKEENSRLKAGLLEELKAIVEAEKVSEIGAVRDIQRRWKEIGWVLQKDIENLNGTYKHFLDIFYNLRAKHNELMDMDRKYNLAEKLKIVEEIRNIVPKEISQNRDEWTEISNKVRHLQEVWRSIGPVPRDESEALNETYKQVLDQFYGMRSEYMEGQEEKRKENGDLKTAILEKLKGYQEFTSDKAKEWNQATQAVLALQEDWKKIGPAPLEQNRQLWKDYRALCDNFFTKKGTYFKDFDTHRNDNLKRKVEICEKAEALAESENFKETAEILKQLQNEWKNIGPVHERHSNKIWKRFRKACDTFFSRRSSAMSGGSGSMGENLKVKEALIEKLKALVETGEANMAAFDEIQAQWKNAGHVPFEDKDRINDGYREAARAFLAIARNSGAGGGGGFKRNPQGKGGHSQSHSHHTPQSEEGGIKFEIQKLRKKITDAKEKIDSYETNILYIAKGKSGDALRAQIQKQIDQEKKQVADWQRKMADLRDQLDNPRPKEEPKVEGKEEPIEPVAPEPPPAE